MKTQSMCLSLISDLFSSFIISLVLGFRFSLIFAWFVSFFLLDLCCSRACSARSPTYMPISLHLYLNLSALVPLFSLSPAVVFDFRSHAASFRPPHVYPIIIPTITSSSYHRRLRLSSVICLSIAHLHPHPHPPSLPRVHTRARAHAHSLPSRPMPTRTRTAPVPPILTPPRTRSHRSHRTRNQPY